MTTLVFDLKATARPLKTSLIEIKNLKSKVLRPIYKNIGN